MERNPHQKRLYHDKKQPANDGRIKSVRDLSWKRVMTKLSTLLYIPRGQRRETWTKTTKTGPTKTRKNNARENGFIITKLSNVFILFTYGKRRVGTGRGGAREQEWEMGGEQPSHVIKGAGWGMREMTSAVWFQLRNSRREKKTSERWNIDLYL